MKQDLRMVNAVRDNKDLACTKKGVYCTTMKDIQNVNILRSRKGLDDITQDDWNPCKHCKRKGNYTLWEY